MLSLILALSQSVNNTVSWYTCQPTKAVLTDIADGNESPESADRKQFKFTISPEGNIHADSVNPDGSSGHLHLTQSFDIGVGSDQVILNWKDGPIDISEIGRWTFEDFGDAYFSKSANCLGTTSYCQRDMTLRKLPNDKLAMTFNMITDRLDADGEVARPRILIATARCELKAQEQ